MRISALFHDVTRVETEVLVAPVWSDVRPPAGLAGRVDWYLCGFISRLIREGRIRGTPGESTLVAVQGKLLTPRLLLVGLGPRKCLGLGDYGRHLRHIAQVVRDLRLSDVALEMPPAERGAGLRALLGDLDAAFSTLANAGNGEIQILSGSEEECESWRKAIREAFPRNRVSAPHSRPDPA